MDTVYILADGSWEIRCLFIRNCINRYRTTSFDLGRLPIGHLLDGYRFCCCFVFKLILLAQNRWSIDLVINLASAKRHCTLFGHYRNISVNCMVCSSLYK